MSRTSNPFATIAKISAVLRKTPGRNEKVALIAELLATLSEDERPIAVDWLSGSPRQGRLGIGWSALAAIEGSGSQRGAALSVDDVDQAFDQLRAISGPGSRSRRHEALARLFERATPLEVVFLEGLLLGNLRQGALRGLMIEAVAAVSGAPIEQARRAHTRSGTLAGALKGTSTVRLFQPLAPMLAGSARNVADALTRLAPALVEAKADGARVQVHRRGKLVRVFSRSGKDISAAAPEIVQAVLGFAGDDLILDGEALVWDGARPSAFQVTMKRLGADSASADALKRLPLRVFFFDCLLAHGTELIDEGLEARRKTLIRLVDASHVLPSVTVARSDGLEEAGLLLTDAKTAGFEGVIVKSLSSPYTAGRRGADWLKVKPVLTLDLVVLAAEWGSGRRTGWLSNLHLGARDDQTGEFVMLGKTFKGMTDALLAWQTGALQALETHRSRGTVWVRPELVVEVAFDGVQTSRKYPAGLTLRFARLKRYRADKNASGADTVGTVRDLLRAQSGADGGKSLPTGPAEQVDLFEVNS